MVIWIKIHDEFGFTGLALEEVNNHISETEIDNLLGESANVTLEDFNDTSSDLLSDINQFLETKDFKLDLKLTRYGSEVTGYAFINDKIEH